MAIEFDKVYISTTGKVDSISFLDLVNPVKIEGFVDSEILVTTHNVASLIELTQYDSAENIINSTSFKDALSNEWVRAYNEFAVEIKPFVDGAFLTYDLETGKQSSVLSDLVVTVDPEQNLPPVTPNVSYPNDFNFTNSKIFFLNENSTLGDNLTLTEQNHILTGTGYLNNTEPPLGNVYNVKFGVNAKLPSMKLMIDSNSTGQIIGQFADFDWGSLTSVEAIIKYKVQVSFHDIKAHGSYCIAFGDPVYRVANAPYNLNPDPSGNCFFFKLFPSENDGCLRVASTNSTNPEFFGTTVVVTDRDIHEFEFVYNTTTNFIEFWFDGVKIADTNSLPNVFFSYLEYFRVAFFLSSNTETSDKLAMSIYGRHIQLILL